MKKIIAIVTLAACIGLAWADTLPEKINTIALFKNGSGYFMSSVAIPEGTEEFDMVPLVTPSHGTFWVSWQQGAEISSLISEEKDIDKQIKAVTIVELLKANVGSRVKLAVRDEFIMGKLIGFEEKDSNPQPMPYRPGREIYPPNFKAQILLLETDSGICALDVNQVTGVTFLSDKLNRDTVESEKKIVITGQCANPSPETEIFINYVGKGITWVPSYVVDITDDNNVTISAKCLIVNEAADIENAQILLITGYPQLEFANVNSPIAMSNTLAEFLGALNSGQSPRYQGVMSNMAKSRGGAMFVAEAADSVASVDYGSAAEGQQIEDMFFYPVENVTLAKDQTGYYPLFSQKVDCKHIYKWDIADNIDRYNRYNNQQQSQQEETVWHCIKLKNTMKQPWTTAPVETVKDNLILGQSTLDYTLPNDEAIVKITSAGAVKASQTEYVKDRVPNSTKFFGDVYDEVTIEGTLLVVNTKNEDVAMEISKTITGKTLNTSPKAEIKKTTTSVGQINENEILHWEITVPGGEKTEIKYTYKAYLRR